MGSLATHPSFQVVSQILSQGQNTTLTYSTALIRRAILHPILKQIDSGAGIQQSLRYSQIVLVRTRHRPWPKLPHRCLYTEYTALEMSLTALICRT